MSDINEITDFTSLRKAKNGGKDIKETLDKLAPGKKDEIDADIELKAAKEEAKTVTAGKESEEKTVTAEKTFEEKIVTDIKKKLVA